MSYKKTQEQFVAEVEQLVGDEYTIIGTYEGTHKKVLIRHNTCGYEYNVIPLNFLHGTRCPQCAGSLTLTNDIFQSRVQELTNNTYEIIGKFTNSKTPILMRHTICGWKFEMKPSNFLAGNRCPKCGHKVRYTTESFIDAVKTQVGDEYTVLGDLITTNQKITMRHNACGYEYDIVARSFLRGTRCAKCAGVIKHTTETYKQRVKELVGDEFIVLGAYAGNKVKIKMQHTVCGWVFETKPNVFLSGSRCPNCRKNKAYTQESFTQKVYELVGDEYEVIGKYVNSQTPITMLHNTCGRHYDVLPSSFLMGHRCSHCFKSVPYTTEEYKSKVEKLVGNRYSVLSEYISANNSIKLRHNVCGFEYEIKPLMFFQGNRCPQCARNLSRSIPEEIVAYFVQQHFDIVQAYRPDWLDLGRKQNGEIDIWIPSIQIGIEYDGIFHNSIESMDRDKIKNNLIQQSTECQKLIRIRENRTTPMCNVPSKVVVLQAESPINISSRVGIAELERMITQLFAELGIIQKKVSITQEIINYCQQKSKR